MKIKKIISQTRRDFHADYECEHCGYVLEDQSGYDDSFFHREVIPNLKCKKCGKTSPDDYRSLAPKYPEHMVV